MSKQMTTETKKPLSWGHTARTPYAKSSVVAVIGLPLKGAYRDELCAAWARGKRTFGKAVFDQLSPGLQDALRHLAAAGVSSL